MTKWTQRRVEFLKQECITELLLNGRSPRWRLLYTIKLRLQLTDNIGGAQQ